MGQQKNYRFGAAACAVAGLPWGVLSAVLRLTVTGNLTELPFLSAHPVLLILVAALEFAALGLILGGIFVEIRHRIPTRHTISKAIIFLLIAWLVMGIVVWLVIVVGYVVPGRFSYPSDRQLEAYIFNLLTGLGIVLLWGATFGYLLDRPKLMERIDFALR